MSSSRLRPPRHPACAASSCSSNKPAGIGPAPARSPANGKHRTLEVVLSCAVVQWSPSSTGFPAVTGNATQPTAEDAVMERRIRRGRACRADWQHLKDAAGLSGRPSRSTLNFAIPARGGQAVHCRHHRPWLPAPSAQATSAAGLAPGRSRRGRCRRRTAGREG